MVLFFFPLPRHDVHAGGQLVLAQHSRYAAPSEQPRNLSTQAGVDALQRCPGTLPRLLVDAVRMSSRASDAAGRVGKLAVEILLALRGALSSSIAGIAGPSRSMSARALAEGRSQAGTLAARRVGQHLGSGHGSSATARQGLRGALSLRAASAPRPMEKKKPLGRRLTHARPPTPLVERAPVEPSASSSAPLATASSAPP